MTIATVTSFWEVFSKLYERDTPELWSRAMPRIQPVIEERSESTCPEGVTMAGALWATEEHGAAPTFRLKTLTRRSVSGVFRVRSC